MRLYDSRRAPNPRRVRWAMAEKGIDDIEVIDVDLFAGEHKTDEYLARAGMPNVPALTLDSGVTITESIRLAQSRPGLRRLISSSSPTTVTG